MSTQFVYLDYAAATPTSPEVMVAMEPYWRENFGNPNSLHRWGQAAHNGVEVARIELLEILGAVNKKEAGERGGEPASGSIVFTASATESNNLALWGVMRAARAKDPRRAHLIVSQIEHDSDLQVARELEKDGFAVTYLAVNKFGQVETQTLRQAIRPGETVLCSVVHGHYQFGTIQDLAELAGVCHQQGVLFHTDAAQTFASQPIDVRAMNIDLLTASGAKIYGPKGIALLYIKNGVEVAAIISGGGQESSLRSGTQDTPLIVGLATAARLTQKKAEVENERLTQLRDWLIAEVQNRLERVTLNGHPSQRLPNNVHFSITGVEGEALLLALDARGIAVSTGSACSSHNLQPDHSLLALGLGPEAAHGSLRITMGSDTTQEKLAYFVDALHDCVENLRQLSPLH